MSRTMIRNLIIFLLINAVLAIFLAVNFFMKSSESKPVPNVATPPVVAPVVTAPIVVPEVAIEKKAEEVIPTTTVTPSVPATAASSAVITPETKKATPSTTPVVAAPVAPVENKLAETIKEETKDIKEGVCVALGPFNIEQKGTMDFILNKNKQTSLAKVEKRTTYQLFWNLGSNKAAAEKSFKKQKEGAMADSKFVLTQNENKDWVVNIVKVNNSSAMAEKLANDLSEKAQKINAGGKWEFKVLPEGYFYIFNDFKKLHDATTTSIEVMLSPSKNPC